MILGIEMKSIFNLAVLVTLALLGYGLYQGLIAAPTEATMGDIQRIFYYHVTSAWTGFLLFFLNFIASIVYLFKREDRVFAQKTDAFALATAEVGCVFTAIVLVTGPIWAKPVWGKWWTWDARLTLTLVLFLLYCSYLLLRRFSTSEQTGTLAAALGIFSFLDVPIVYMAIRWWRTQHPQPVIAGGQGSGLDPQMWQAVLWNWLAFSCFAALIVTVRYKLARAEQHQLETETLHALADEHLAAREARI
jgi:heme exporter protein C